MLFVVVYDVVTARFAVAHWAPVERPNLKVLKANPLMSSASVTDKEKDSSSAAPKREKPSKKMVAAVVLAFMATGLLGWRGYEAYQDHLQAKALIQPYSRFAADVESGKVRHVEVSTNFLGEEVKVKLKDNKEYTVTAPHIETEKAIDLAKQGIEVEFKKSSSDLGRYISLLPTLLLLVLFGAMMFPGLIGGNFRRSAKPTTRFDDVAGADEAKAALQDIVGYLRDPKAYERLGAKFPRGVIMHGDPGTGKTLLARAVAGEAGASFFAVSGSDFSSMFVGVSGMKVRSLFARARKMAPCIIFIDEIDAIGGKRLSEGTATAREMGSTLNQLLVQMDGFEDSAGVVVIAATNRLELLDPALLRPGRFDRKIHMPAPSLKEREAILRIHTKNVGIEPGFNHPLLARSTIGMSGAELANVVNMAAILAVKEQAQMVTTMHALRARDMIVMGEARHGLSKAFDESTRRVLAAHEAGHAVTALAIGPDPVTRVSIVPRGHALGVTMMSPSQDRFVVDDAHLHSQLCILLGGRAAEQLVLGIRTTGARDDLSRATQLARDMVCSHAMNDFGLMQVDDSSSDQMRYAADRRVQKILSEAMEKTIDLLSRNRQILDKMIEQLLKYEELDEESVKQIVQNNGPITGAPLPLEVTKDASSPSASLENDLGMPYRPSLSS